MLFQPNHERYEELDEVSRGVMLKTIEYFETLGKNRLLQEYHNQEWYADFIHFLKENRVFSTLLSTNEFSDGQDAKRWDTYRICLMNEILAFYGLPFWYAWQVSILGLGPIWMSSNQLARKKAASFLDQGGIFAFGLSEKEHGADLYSSEMRLKKDASGNVVAHGSKYYIGNGNKARMISTFGMDENQKEYVFFSVDSEHPNYKCLDNLIAWQGYVAEYKLDNYPVDEEDILSRGSDAWDAALNTVNVGKFNLGWASIGICTHAFYEAITHASHRNLYGKYVTEFSHVRQLFVDAYCRLISMRLFAGRARDYFRSATPEDRRYLLYNPLVKMKVTTQGEEVIDLLWDVIAAKGFEKSTYFEMAAKEIRALPKLEGTVHVNMALVVKFMKNYFFNPKSYPEIPKRIDAVEDAFLFNQGPTKGLSQIQFHDYHEIYNLFHSPNIEIFKSQIGQFREFLEHASPNQEQGKDIDFLLLLGELFSLVVYGQFILEAARMQKIETGLLEQIFDFLVRDFSKFALKLYSKPSTTQKQMAKCLEMIKKPHFDADRYHAVWENHVAKWSDFYEMKQ